MATRLLLPLQCARNALRVTHAVCATDTPRFGLDGADALANLAYVERRLSPGGARTGWEPLATAEPIPLGDARLTMIPCKGAAGDNPSAAQTFLARIEWKDSTILVVSDIRLNRSDWTALSSTDLTSDVLVLPAADTTSATEQAARAAWIAQIVRASNPKTVVFTGQCAPWMREAVAESARPGIIILDTFTHGAVRFSPRNSGLVFDTHNKEHVRITP